MKNKKSVSEISAADTVQKSGSNKETAWKAVIVLVLIGVILGGMLAILNDVLYVSAEERTMRTIREFYDGEEKAFGTVFDKNDEKYDGSPIKNEYGEISVVYKIEEDGNYLIQATGYHGFHEGTVTLWVLASFEGNSFVGFKQIKCASYQGQTLMSNFGDDFYDVYIQGDITKGFYTTSKSDTNHNVVANTTMSSRAINNAINCVYYYIVNDLEVG